MHKEFPSVSFIHAYPGFVNTSLANNSPFYIRIPLNVISKLFATPAHETGETMTFALTSPQYKKGWYLVNEKGDKVEPLKSHTEEMREVIWNHTLDMLSLVKQ